jgi:Fur family ferric uptake transcriptional regulator
VRTQLGDNVWRFELLHTTAQHGLHAHFVCTECGRVSCLPENAVTLCSDMMRNQVSDVQLRDAARSVPARRAGPVTDWTP